MEKPKATFYPNLIENLKYTLSLCIIAGLFLCIAIALKYGFTLKGILGVAIFESVVIPFTFLLAIAGTYNFKIKIYDNGISSPSQFLSIPYKWEFIRWDEIKEIRIVKVFFMPYFLIISEDERFQYLPKKMQKHKLFVETIKYI